MTDTPELHGPLPLLYDIEGDRIYVGHPGERHADIAGKFSPGGVVEGVYDPKGNLQVRTDTDTPWTVYHLTRLWYAMHPELEIKHVYRLVGEERFKLASSNIAARCVQTFACDPLWEPAQELMKLGNVYLDGETVKQVVTKADMSPGDFRIVVQGVEPDEVREIVSHHAGAGAMVRVRIVETLDGVVNPFGLIEHHLASANSKSEAPVAVNIATAELIDPYHHVEQWMQDEAPSLVSLNDIMDLEWTAEDAKTANILDPVKETLSAEVFDDPTSPAPDVKPEVADFARKTIVKAMVDAGWPDPEGHGYLKLILTGSLCTYQYDDTGSSDFDVSLFVDAQRMPEWVRGDLVRVMVESVDGTMLPGTQIPLQAFCVPAGITREMLYIPNTRAGYDLDRREWIVPPFRPQGKVSDSMRAYANMVVDKLKLLLMYAPETAKIVWHDIHQKRRRDMQGGGGDFAESNVVFKAVGKAGLYPVIERLTGEHL